MTYSTAAATRPATTCTTTYGSTSRAGMRRAAHNPTVTAGLKCPPEIDPNAYAPVSTVSPNASATPAKPIPSFGYPAARTALPHPPSTSQNVPKTRRRDGVRARARSYRHSSTWRDRCRGSAAASKPPPVWIEHKVVEQALHFGGARYLVAVTIATRLAFDALSM